MKQPAIVMLHILLAFFGKFIPKYSTENIGKLDCADGQMKNSFVKPLSSKLMGVRCFAIADLQRSMNMELVSGATDPPPRALPMWGKELISPGV